jgi:membrane protein
MSRSISRPATSFFPRIGSAWGLLRKSVTAFLADEVLTLAAALAFYTLLSFAPLIVLAVAGAALAGPDAQARLIEQIGSVIGPEAQGAARAVLDSGKSHPQLGSIVGMAGLAVAVVGATTVFAQLQASLNRIFGVVATPSNALWGWLRRRVISFGVIFAIGFVLVASLVVSALLGWFLPRGSLVLDSANQIVSAAVFSVLFGLLFRYLPDARIPWHWAWLGGLTTAILFSFGKWAISFYVARSHVGGAYGGAASLAVLLIWVYYVGAIFFYGAELTKAWLERRGIRIVPLPHAERAA